MKNKKLRFKKFKQSRLKEALLNRKNLNKLINLTDKIEKLDDKENEANPKDSNKNLKTKTVDDLRLIKTKFLKAVQDKLKGRLSKSLDKALNKKVQNDPVEFRIDLNDDTNKKRMNRFNLSNSRRSDIEFKASSKPNNKEVHFASFQNEKTIKEYSCSMSSSDSLNLSGNDFNGGDNLTLGLSKKKESIFAIENAEQIEKFLSNLRINQSLNKIKFIDFNSDNTVTKYTRLEFIEFENKLKKQRIELDLCLFAFKHFNELIWKNLMESIESIDLISKWVIIKDEKINFWSKLNQSVYVKIEVDPENYDLVIKDDNNNLIRFTRNNFHQIIKTLTNKITTYEYMLKSMKIYIDKIDDKRQLINLNLVNLFNFKAKKFAYKNLDKRLKDSF